MTTPHTGRELLRQMGRDGWSMSVGDYEYREECGTSGEVAWAAVESIDGGAVVEFRHADQAKPETALLIPSNGAEECLSDYTSGGYVAEKAATMAEQWDHAWDVEPARAERMHARR